VNGWARAYAVNTYSWGSPRGSLGADTAHRSQAGRTR
jgi:hypothetical protein